MQAHNLTPLADPEKMPDDWLVPRWPAPAHVRAVCTSRSGGVSQGPYASFNLGLHVGDVASHVLQNRHTLHRLLGVRPVFLNQVHGLGMLDLSKGMPDGDCADGARAVEPGVACAIMVADCLPVLLCDPPGTQVAAVHAGWRGLSGVDGVGVLEAMVRKMREKNRPGQAVQPLLAWLGPCIGPQAFEVGPEVRSAFLQSDAEAEMHFQPHAAGKWLANLPALARQRLTRLGAIEVYGNDGSDAWCTVSQPSRYFSHRRDRVSGRMAACIWRTV